MSQLYKPRDSGHLFEEALWISCNGFPQRAVLIADDLASALVVDAKDRHVLLKGKLSLRRGIDTTLGSTRVTVFVPDSDSLEIVVNEITLTAVPR